MQRSHNTTLPKVTYDQQAKFGAKGKNKFWYGFKKHVSVDIQSGLINKVALTPANITDANGLKHVVPSIGLLSMVGIMLVIFFVTSSDSGSLVIDTITAGGKENVPVQQRIFWCS
ncbi:High-affinity choline uptake protein BetT [uncultured Gammaproteobacteria bacterium]|nr:High-affinity choline uptake protein BetT [uncultured Gammaproteobacteria bacterium]CAC9634730.1 High-affinity choline uptake protein BetT [uncultured Gammaproteobacteria bacterium]CAC9635774.1 High-affinity choline uptake protein BetT [uncultured Gammaproteobacteria bacterium]